MSSPSSPSSTRLSGLDALRGLAVLLMVGQHLTMWLWRGPLPGESQLDYPILLAVSAAGGLAAPLFITLAGCGAALSYQSRAPQNPDFRLLFRAVALAILAYLLSAITPSWFTWKSFYVLHLIAAGFALGPLLRRLPQTALLTGVACVAIATATLQNQLQLPSIFSNAYMSARPGQPNAEPALWAASLRALAAGHFPLLPWLIPFGLGFAFASTLTSRSSSTAQTSQTGPDRPTRRKNRGLRLAAVILSISLGLLALGAFKVFPRYSYPWLYRLCSPNAPFFPASPAMVGTLSGVSLLLMALITRVKESPLWSPDATMTQVGRVSLTVLMLHLPLFRELSRPVGLWRTLSPGQSMGILIAFVVLILIAAPQWRKIGFRYGAEWLFRQVDRFVPKKTG